MPEPDTTSMPPVPEPNTVPMSVEAQEEETDEDECWGNWRPTSSTTASNTAPGSGGPAASSQDAVMQEKFADLALFRQRASERRQGVLSAIRGTQSSLLNSYGAKYAPKGASHTTEVSDYTTKGANHAAKESAKESPEESAKESPEESAKESAKESSKGRSSAAQHLDSTTSAEGRSEDCRSEGSKSSGSKATEGSESSGSKATEGSKSNGSKAAEGSKSSGSRAAEGSESSDPRAAEGLDCYNTSGGGSYDEAYAILGFARGSDGIPEPTRSDELYSGRGRGSETSY
ncbi:unnamed protein product, partial [Symbiodinium sp. CCMP2592]